MNSKERVRTALNHQDTDRVPIQIYTTPEIMKALTTHFRTREILPILGIDFRTVAATRVRPGPAVPEGCDFADE